MRKNNIIGRCSGRRLYGIDRNIKRAALVAAIELYTGEKPIVNEYSTYDEIIFTDNQKRLLRDQLTRWNRAEPGDVRVQVAPIMLPWAAKTYGAYLIGVLGAGFLLGFLLKK